MRAIPRNSTARSAPAYYEDELAALVLGLDGPDRTVESALLRGRPASVIVDEARAFAADLVVVGSRGHGAIESLVLGSVSGEVVDHAPCPVLVARRSELASVIFAADESPSATTAEAILARWSMFDGSPIHVVSVVDSPDPRDLQVDPTIYGQVMDAYTRDLAEARIEHQRIADASVQRLREIGRTVTAELRSGDAASEIIAAASERNADLVVLGTRGRTGLTRLLLGSVARNVLHGSTASVMVVRDRVDA